MALSPISTSSPGLYKSLIFSAHAFPKTTISNKELAPKRFAP